MPALTGNNGAIIVGGVTLAAVRNFSIELTRDTIETTVMGKDVRSYVGGMASFSGSADIYFDTSEFDTNETTFNPTTGTVGTGVITSAKFYLAKELSGSTSQVFTGDIIITGYTVSSSMDGLVEASISFQGTATSGGVGAVFSTNTLGQ
jgi:hypothetical protein